MNKRKPPRELIGCRCGEDTLPAEAVAIKDGLAVHRAVNYSGSRPWRVTHIASGLLATGVHYATQADACMALGRLTMFLDWSMDEVSITRSDAHMQAYYAEATRNDLGL